MDAWKNVDEYIAAAPEEIQPKLILLRATIRKAAPDAVESISYGMPFYSFKGEAGFKARLCYFGASKRKIVFYMRPFAFEEHVDEVSEYKSTKSALHFPVDKEIPIPLIKKLIRTGIKKHKAEKLVSNTNPGKPRNRPDT